MKKLFLLGIVMMGLTFSVNLSAADGAFLAAMFQSQNCDTVAQNPSDAWFEKDSVFPEVIQKFGEIK